MSKENTSHIQKNGLRILELYCGIGGMHQSFKDSGLEGDIIMAMDLNPLATSVYKHNFPEIDCRNKNILSLTAQHINDLNINTILMSPPCQPFTRNGNQKDVEDARTSSFLHLLNIIPDIQNLEYVLLENVMGFEKSIARDALIKMFTKSNFNIHEYLRTPNWVGIPNSRMRYYCLARKNHLEKPLKHETKFDPIDDNDEILSIDNFIETESIDEFLLPDKVLTKYAWVLDICHPNDKRSTCFTKAYTHYANGTGSVFTTESKETVDAMYEKCRILEPGSKELLNSFKTLKLRYFTPKEVSRLMCFPDDFSFPNNTTRKQCYRLLGNSINVKVVSRLLSILVSMDEL